MVAQGDQYPLTDIKLKKIILRENKQICHDLLDAYFIVASPQKPLTMWRLESHH